MIETYRVYTPLKELVGKFSTGVIIKNKKTKMSWPEVWINSKLYLSCQFGRSNGRTCFAKGLYFDSNPEIVTKDELEALQVINKRLEDKNYLAGLRINPLNEYEFFVIEWTSVQFPKGTDAKKYIDARFPYKHLTTLKPAPSKKKPQLVMQAVDRTEYDPKTGKVKSLPDGEKIPLVFGTPKKRQKNVFEKAIGMYLGSGDQYRACLNILQRAFDNVRINPDEIAIGLDDSKQFFIGCYGMTVQLLEEKKLISRKLFPNYPTLTKKGLAALEFLKGFCDDKCCHGC